MLIVELNEFDPNFFKRVSEELNLQHINKILSLKHGSTFTDEKVEYQGLDPWVQWVSIHTGKSFKEHKICRLSDTKKQNFKQIWNLFGENKNYSCGIWGVMNAPRGDKNGIKFFVPDPWSFDELATPKSLNKFLSLPRYIAKNYLSINILKLLHASLRMINFIYQNRGKGKTRKFFKMLFKSFFIAGINVHTFSTLLDFLSTLYFIQLKDKYNTNFNIIFLNHIAHIQHQFWEESGAKISKHMKLALIVCNEILGMLMDSQGSNEPLLVVNGIRQKFVKGDGFFIYRQKDPISFFKKLGIRSIVTEQNMTNDGILIFDNLENRDKAVNILKNLSLKSDKKKIFDIEILDEKRVFYQIQIKSKIKIDEMILLEEKSFKFFDYIECICERTGAHIQEGDIFYKGFKFPAKIYNHEIYDYLSKSLLDNNK